MGSRIGFFDAGRSLLYATCMDGVAGNGRCINNTSYGADISATRGFSYQSNVTFSTEERYDDWSIGGLSGIDLDCGKGQFVTLHDNTQAGYHRPFCFSAG